VTSPEKSAAICLFQTSKHSATRRFHGRRSGFGGVGRIGTVDLVGGLLLSRVDEGQGMGVARQEDAALAS